MSAPLLGIDIGGTKILAAVVTAEGQVLSRSKLKTKVEEGSGNVLARVAQAAGEAMQLANVTPAGLECAGVGVPSPVDAHNGIVYETPNMGWRNYPLGSVLRERLGLPVFLANDVNAGTWGEYALGAAKGSRSCMGVFVGTGVGAGIVLNGELYEGANGVAGELGHICLDPKGPVCGCGRKGCLESFASRTAITREIWAAIKAGAKSKTLEGKPRGGQIRSKQLLKGLLEGDKVISAALEKGAKYMGIGLAAAAQILNPDCIVLGGGVVEALSDRYLNLVRAAFEARTFKSVSSATTIAEAKLADDAGVLGAALLGQRANQRLGAQV